MIYGHGLSKLSKGWIGIVEVVYLKSGSLKDHIIIIEVLFTSAVNSQLKFRVQFISLKEQTGN